MTKHDAAYIAKHQPGPLEDVIKYLEAILVAHQEVHYSYDGSIELPVAPDASIRAAIRILEAAAKVGPEVNDKNGERWEWFISGLRQKWPELAALLVAIRAALPDGGGND